MSSGFQRLLYSEPSSKLQIATAMLSSHGDLHASKFVLQLVKLAPTHHGPSTSASKPSLDPAKPAQDSKPLSSPSTIGLVHAMMALPMRCCYFTALVHSKSRGWWWWISLSKRSNSTGVGWVPIVVGGSVQSWEISQIPNFLHFTLPLTKYRNGFVWKSATSEIDDSVLNFQTEHSIELPLCHGWSQKQISDFFYSFIDLRRTE